ncbi:hypothetical protein BVC80_753g13 [Macleaya cordata]|uniref:UBC core domain-containing protein n=1 Tax=Macleaya cordata TaxID=56857 RepID=A0A200QS19_MACCD|nr:hypothetical protein BVC80_753g13 [Macleaya cordata]
MHEPDLQLSLLDCNISTLSGIWLSFSQKILHPLSYTLLIFFEFISLGTIQQFCCRGFRVVLQGPPPPKPPTETPPTFFDYFIDFSVVYTIYPDERVCISILHAPGDDPNGYELASERWTPVHTV